MKSLHYNRCVHLIVNGKLNVIEDAPLVLSIYIFLFKLHHCIITYMCAFIHVYICIYMFFSSSDWTIVVHPESSSSWFPESCLTHTMDYLNTQLMTLTLCRSAPCQPLWTTIMSGNQDGWMDFILNQCPKGFLDLCCVS